MEDMMNPMLTTTRSDAAKLPESPRLPMEFLSRSWNLSTLQLSKALSHSLPSLVSKTPNPEDVNPHQGSEQGQKSKLISGHSFSFASSATSQLVLERIMSQSEVSPLTSGRPSCSEPINNGGPLNLTEMESPPLSPPRDFDYKFLSSISTPQPLLPSNRVAPKNCCSTPSGGTRTVGRWLKERRERKKEEARAQNAQIHAAVSIAALAAAMAATTAATAASSGSRKENDHAAMNDMAMASAATLVAARCVEAAEAMGAEHDHLASVLSSAVNVQSYGDIMTLTAAAATALRGAATLKARTMKEVCNIAAVLPVEKGIGAGTNNGELLTGDALFGLFNEQVLARGSELLKRTRKGDLHWKIVSVYTDKLDQVVLKMKSRHVAGAITKKKKEVLLEVVKDMPVWQERYFVDGAEEKRYFGLKTSSHRVIEFECKSQQEHDVWTQGVSRLLCAVMDKRL